MNTVTTCPQFGSLLRTSRRAKSVGGQPLGLRLRPKIATLFKAGANLYDRLTGELSLVGNTQRPMTYTFITSTPPQHGAKPRQNTLKSTKVTWTPREKKQPVLTIETTIEESGAARPQARL